MMDHEKESPGLARYVTPTYRYVVARDGGKTLQEFHEDRAVRIDDREGAREAVRWLMAAEPSVSIAMENGAIVLRSASLDGRRLENALLCALLNERLLAANADGRVSVMQELLA